MFKNAFENEEAIKAHELCHIKYHDGLISTFLFGMTYFCISSSLHKGFSPSRYLALRIGQTTLKEGFSLYFAFRAYIAYVRYTEKRADLSSFPYCSKENQRKAIESFKQTQKINQASLGFGIFSEGIAENGDDLNDWAHPLLSERIRYLTQAYREIHGEEPF